MSAIEVNVSHPTNVKMQVRTQIPTNMIIELSRVNEFVHTDSFKPEYKHFTVGTDDMHRQVLYYPSSCSSGIKLTTTQYVSKNQSV